MIIVLNRKELSKEIKRANTRLVALEKKGLADTSRAYQYVFSEMSNRYNLTSVSKSGHLKFVTSLKNLNESDIKTLQANVRNFLKAQTSTITGAKKVLKAKTENFKKQLGNNIYKKYTESEQYKRLVDNAFSSEAIKSAYDKFGSEQVLKITKEIGIENSQTIFTKALSDNIETLTELYDIIKVLE